MSTQTQELPAIASRYAGFVPNGESEVPAEIEQYLAELSASVAEWTRAMELSSDGVVAGAQYLQRAGARAAARLTMKVEERSGDAPGTEEQVKARLMAAFPEARVVPADLLRLTVPVRVTRAQRIVLDVELGAPTESRVHVRLRGFGMEGRPSRKKKPTQTVTDQAWAAITSDGS